MAKITTTKSQAGAVAAVAAAEQQVTAAWAEYQQTEQRGLEFGHALYNLRKKYSAQGSRTGGGLAQFLRKLGCKEGKAYYWLHTYRVSIREVKEIEIPEQLEDQRKQSLYEANKRYQEAEQRRFDNLSNEEKKAETDKKEAREQQRRQQTEAADRAYQKWKAEHGGWELLMPTSDDTIIDFFNMLSFDAIKAAWKIQAAIYHPDKGGSHMIASKFNGLWEQVKTKYKEMAA
jgi:aminopeptidase N